MGPGAGVPSTSDGLAGYELLYLCFSIAAQSDLIPFPNLFRCSFLSFTLLLLSVTKTIT